MKDVALITDTSYIQCGTDLWCGSYRRKYNTCQLNDYFSWYPVYGLFIMCCINDSFRDPVQCTSGMRTPLFPGPYIYIEREVYTFRVVLNMNSTSDVLQHNNYIILFSIISCCDKVYWLEGCPHFMWIVSLQLNRGVSSFQGCFKTCLYWLGTVPPPRSIGSHYTTS